MNQWGIYHKQVYRGTFFLPPKSSVTSSTLLLSDRVFIVKSSMAYVYWRAKEEDEDRENIIAAWYPLIKIRKVTEERLGTVCEAGRDGTGQMWAAGGTGQVGAGRGGLERGATYIYYAFRYFSFSRTEPHTKPHIVRLHKELVVSLCGSRVRQCFSGGFTNQRV